MQRRILSLSVPAMRVFREQAGISLHDLAKRTGISASNLQRIESGNAVPRLTTAEKIALALDKSLKELWELRL